MKHPFPTHRLDTITRANIALALMEHPELDTAKQVAEFLHGKTAAERHTRRCDRLMRGSIRSTAATEAAAS